MIAIATAAVALTGQATVRHLVCLHLSGTSLLLTPTRLPILCSCCAAAACSIKAFSLSPFPSKISMPVPFALPFHGCSIKQLLPTCVLQAWEGLARVLREVMDVLTGDEEVTVVHGLPPPLLTLAYRLCSGMA